MRVFVVYLQGTDEKGVPCNKGAIYKEKKAAVQRANEWHDAWSEHNYKRSELWWDETTGQSKPKDCKLCYRKSDNERHRKCSLYHASIWIEEIDMDLDSVNSAKSLLEFNL
jgi:hypothetical protein